MLLAGAVTLGRPRSSSWLPPREVGDGTARGQEPLVLLGLRMDWPAQLSSQWAGTLPPGCKPGVACPARDPLEAPCISLAGSRGFSASFPSGPSTSLARSHGYSCCSSLLPGCLGLPVRLFPSALQTLPGAGGLSSSGASRCRAVQRSGVCGRRGWAVLPAEASSEGKARVSGGGLVLGGGGMGPWELRGGSD